MIHIDVDFVVQKDDNSLAGVIPSEIGRLTNLMSVNCCECHFSAVKLAAVLLHGGCLLTFSFCFFDFAVQKVGI